MMIIMDSGSEPVRRSPISDQHAQKTRSTDLWKLEAEISKVSEKILSSFMAPVSDLARTIGWHVNAQVWNTFES